MRRDGQPPGGHTRECMSCYNRQNRQSSVKQAAAMQIGSPDQNFARAPKKRPRLCAKTIREREERIRSLYYCGVQRLKPLTGICAVQGPWN